MTFSFSLKKKKQAAHLREADSCPKEVKLLCWAWDDQGRNYTWNIQNRSSKCKVRKSVNPICSCSWWCEGHWVILHVWHQRKWPHRELELSTACCFSQSHDKGPEIPLSVLHGLLKSRPTPQGSLMSPSSSTGLWSCLKFHKHKKLIHGLYLTLHMEWNLWLSYLLEWSGPSKAETCPSMGKFPTALAHITAAAALSDSKCIASTDRYFTGTDPFFTETVFVKTTFKELLKLPLRAAYLLHENPNFLKYS